MPNNKILASEFIKSKGYSDETEDTAVASDSPVDNFIREKGYEPKEPFTSTIPDPVALQSAGLKRQDLRTLPISAFESGVRVDQGDLNWSLQTYKGVSPDVAAKVNRIAKEQDINYESAMANKDEWGQWQEAQDIYNSILEKDDKGQHKYPYVAEWLANPEKMAINKDDVTALKDIELAIRRQDQADDNFFQKQIQAAQYTLETMNVALAQTPAVAYTAAATLGGLSKLGLPKTIPFLSDNPLVDYYKERQDYYFRPEMKESMFKQIADGEYGAAIENFGLKVSAQMPNMLVAMGAFAAGQPALGLQVLGTISGTGGFTEALESGKTPEQATTTGLIYKASEMMFEAAGTMTWMKKLMDEAGKNLGKASAKQFIKTLGNTYLSHGGQEGLEELGTEVTQVLTDILTGSDIKFKQALERIGESFIVGFGSGGATSVSMTSMSHLSKRNTFKRNTENFNKMEEAIEKINTNKTDPSNTKDFIDKQTKEKDKNVYFNSEEFAMLYQEKPEEVDKLVKDLGLVDKVAKSLNTGEDIVVDKGDLLSQYVATDILEDVKKFMAFTPSGITLNNEKITEKQFTEELQRKQDEAIALEEETRLPDQVVTMRNQMMESGQKAADVDVQLAPLLAGAKTLSKQRKVIDENGVERTETQEEWFDRVQPRVEIGGKFVEKAEPTGITYNQETGQINQNENFKKWFGDSKVVNETGEPLVVYHGTENKFDEFVMKPLIDFPDASYFSDNIKIAETYTTPNNKIILETYLKMENPYIVDAQGQDFNTYYDQMVSDINFAKNNNYDGLIVKNFRDDWVQKEGNAKGNTYVAFDPTQIKSVDNQGTFAVDDPNIYKQEVSEESVTTNILNELKGKDTVSKQFIMDQTNRGNIKQAERDLIRKALEDEGKKVNVEDFIAKVQLELVPLTVNTKSDRYENIALSDNLRGDVKDYKENIYESPIKTQAGSVHFSGDTDNYFAHTRIEDMADNETRRVIEVQSDLFQKGKLESEKRPDVDYYTFLFDTVSSFFKNIEKENFDTVEKLENEIIEFKGKDSLQEIKNIHDFRMKKNKGVEKLQPYRNTYHERIIKEEVRRAAIDGIEKLQFPVGETAMKIEGLGLSSEWKNLNGELLKPDTIKVGQEIYERSENFGKWIITYVLEDGKFKAVPQKYFNNKMDRFAKENKRPLSIEEIRNGALKKIIDNNYSNQETFDISGKVDTQNPIYKFYEKDIQKYLKKNYQAKRVTDGNDVEWMEVDIKPEYNAPVTAFQKQDKIVRGSVQFTPSETVINLFKSANMSTFLHESFHILERDMSNLIAEGKADEQLKTDYNTLLEFADGKMDTKGKEKVARGFEAYMREGKAPSVKLAKAFDRFKQWLTNIYRSLANLDVEINDDIRGVFNRLLASEVEINEAQSYYEIRDNYNKLNLNKKQTKKLDNKLEKADLTSTQLQAKKKLQAFDRAIGGRNIYKERATKEIEAMPVYMVIDDVRDRGGFDSDEIVSTYGKDTLKQMNKHKGIIFNPLSDKKSTTYQKLVLDNGGIKSSSLSDAQKKELRESGTFGAMRKDGRALDELAEDLVNNGELEVPNNKNKDDYLLSLIVNKVNYTAPSEVSFLDDISGESLTEFVIAYDFESDEDLVNKLIEAPTKSQAIKQRTQEMQDKVEQDILADQEVQEQTPGEESIHNDASFAFNIAEAQVYLERVEKKKRATVRKIDAQALRDEAHKQVYNKKVKNATNYSVVAASEQSHAKKALAFAKEGKFVEAVEEKRKQTLCHAIVQESIRARDQKKAIEARYKTKKIEPRLKNTENDFANIAIDLMRLYELNTGKKLVVSEQGVINRLEELDETLYSATPDWILQGLNRGDYRELTMNQLVELDDTLVGVMGAGSKQLKSMKDTEYKTSTELKDDSIESMNELDDKRIATDDDSLFTQKLLKVQEGVLAPYKMISFVFERLDNYKLRKTNKAGALGKLYNEFNKKESVSKEIKDEVTDDIKPSFDILSNANERMNKLHDGRVFDIDDVPMPEFMAKAGKNKWTFERVVAFVLNMGNEGNLNALRNSFNYTDEQINKVAAQLTKEELLAVQNIWDSIDKLYPKLDAVHFNIYNRHLAKVAARQKTIINFEGETVTLKGGYYPLQYDTQVSVKALKTVDLEQALKDDMKNRNNSMLMKTTPEDGFKYARKEGVSLPPKLELGVLLNHISDTARFISHAEVMRDANTLIRNTEWAETVIAKEGRKFYNELKKWSSYQASPQRNIQSTWENGLEQMRSLSTTAILGLNIGVSLLQRFSTIQAMSKIGADYVLQGMADTDMKGLAFGMKSSKSYQQVFNLSSYLRIRENNFNREISDIVNRVKFGAKSFKIGDRDFTVKDLHGFAFSWIQMMDRATVVPIWKGAYQKFMDQNVKGDATQQDINDAINFADDVIEKTQPSTLPTSLNSLQRAEGMLRLFTSFMTFTMKLGNIYISEYKAWQDGAITNDQFFRHVMYDYLIAGISVMVFRSLLYSGEIPEWWEYLTAPFEQILGTMPIGRDIPGYFKNGRDIGSIPAFSGPNRTLKGIKSLKQGITGDKEWDKVWLDIGKGLEVWAKITPVKFAQDVKRKYKNIENLLNNN